MKLSHDEIDEANARLVERHPLFYCNMTVGDVFPFLKWLGNIKMPGMKGTDENKIEPLLDSEDERSDGFRQGKKENERYMKIHTQKVKSKKGFLTLGYGFVAYFNFLEFIILIFGALTLLSLPSMYFYWNYRDTENENIGWMNKLQMGNLGYSSALWRDVHLGVGKLTLSWSTGVIKKVVAFGIIPENAHILDACLPNTETEVWSSILIEENATKIINDKWLDQEIWTLDVGSFVNKTQGENAKWVSEDARFFTQVLCQSKDDKEMSERKSIQLVLIWTTIISALVYFIGLEFVDSYAEAKLEEYDQDTTTSSDFTAIYKIPEELYENFVQNIYPVFNEFLYKTTGKSHVPIMAFKIFLQDGIEKQLSDEKDEKIEKEEKRSESLTPILGLAKKSFDDKFF